jgi:hypothetical protein
MRGFILPLTLLASLLLGCQETQQQDPSKGALLFDAALDENLKACEDRQESKLGIDEEEAHTKCKCASDRLKVSLSPAEKNQFIDYVLLIQNHAWQPASVGLENALARAGQDASTACGLPLD